MNKPDQYFPLDGADFVMAMQGQPNHVRGAYVMLLLHYWHHNHCEGLDDDRDFLRGLCNSTSTEWKKVNRVIFESGRFFRQGTDGLWHQKRADEAWQKCQGSILKKSLAGRAGAAGKWRKYPGRQSKYLPRDMPNGGKRSIYTL